MDSGSGGPCSSSGECTSGAGSPADKQEVQGGVSQPQHVTKSEQHQHDQVAATEQQDSDNNQQDSNQDQSQRQQQAQQEEEAERQQAQHKTKLPRPTAIVPCPRCQSTDTKFCYYNNYNIKQPRYFCKVSDWSGPVNIQQHRGISVLKCTHILNLGDSPTIFSSALHAC